MQNCDCYLRVSNVFPDCVYRSNKKNYLTTTKTSSFPKGNKDRQNVPCNSTKPA